MRTHASTKQPYVTSLIGIRFYFISSNILNAPFKSFILPYAFINMPYVTDDGSIYLFFISLNNSIPFYISLNLTHASINELYKISSGLN